VTTSDWSQVGVCIPAHNEAGTIADCLRSVLRAAAGVSIPVHIVVAADACTDETVRWAAAMKSPAVTIEEINARSVGVARRYGIRCLQERLGERGTWLATTDADSLVPPDWLVRQLAYGASGFGLVCGTVTVSDWADHTCALRRHVVDEYARPARESTAGHGHIHGANLGFSATAYATVGGFASIDYNEDVELVAAAEVSGVPIAWAADIPVTTSSRLVGRTPNGFARYLTFAHLAVLRSAALTDRSAHSAPNAARL
jgi:glycosyltransferase involved in cell wall biosynthesis